MKKLLFIQAVPRHPSGGSAVASWMLEALKREYAVTILTWHPYDFAAPNRCYGTSLRPDEFMVRCAPGLLRPFRYLDPDPWSFQPTSYLLRVCKKIADEYDVLCSADDETDFGRRGLQYVHYPHLARHYERQRRLAEGAGSSTLRRLLRGETRPWMVVAGYSFDRMKSNLTLVNSNWTARLFKEVYGSDADTVYPPVPGDFPDVPWSQRENGIVCLGRPSPLKRFELAVEVLQRVRERVSDVRLHIVTNEGQTPDERSYYARTRAVAKAHASWIHLHVNLPREELTRLVSRQRFGFHARVDEHFGIAPAELICAGCITFVHNSGGQVEIVDRDPRLVWDTADDAVHKIAAVVDDTGQQADLSDFLRGRRELFSVETFSAAIRRAAGRLHGGGIAGHDEDHESSARERKELLHDAR